MLVAMERIRTGVIVVAGYAEHGKVDASDDFQGFSQMTGTVDEVAGETDEIGPFLMDGRDDAVCKAAVSPVMEVGNMHEPAG